MASVCFYFQVHQPFRIRRYSVFDNDPWYFDESQNREICRKVARKCYLPANAVLLDMVKKWEGKFRCSYSITGVAIEQFEAYAPEVLDSFRALAETGCVEFIAETYYHSLSFLYSRDEFAAQVKLQREMVERLFGQKATTFRNTELIYNDEVGQAASSMGFSAVIAEGADRVLGYRSPTFLYSPPGTKGTALLLKNYRLSDDIAFRFGNRAWPDWPLTAPKFAEWVHRINGNGYICNLFMDYETFGEHQWVDTGIFDFLKHLPGELFKLPDNDFVTPREVAKKYPVSAELPIPQITSWADTERDLSAWRGNDMQHHALDELYRLEQPVKAKGDENVLRDWRKLTTSDHFYYMCTKYWADGDVHKYFSPYDSPYDAYINYMNVLDNLRSRLGL